MTDRTRAQLIEQAAQVLYRAQNPKGLGWPTQAEAEADAARADDGQGLIPGDLVALRECYLKLATALADAGLLADPEKAISLTYYQELAAGYKGQMARADALQTRIDATARGCEAALALISTAANPDARDLAETLVEGIRAAVRGGKPTEPADVHPGRPVLPITDDDFDLLETEEL